MYAAPICYKTHKCVLIESTRLNPKFERRCKTLSGGRHLLGHDRGYNAASTSLSSKHASPAAEGKAAKARRSPFLTGGRIGTTGSSRALLLPDQLPLECDKQIVLVRHGQSQWNLDKRIQGSSNETHLTAFGKEQAIVTRKALENYPFKACFSSPISRAREFAEVLWDGHDGQEITFNRNLEEANLGWLQGMTNEHAAHAHSDVYGAWRSRPEKFEIDGRKPIHEVFDKAAVAWQNIILHPSDLTLVVTHKSILRALICTAIGLGPESFRAIDVHNAGVTCFWINKNSEAMLQHLNMTSHLGHSVMY